MPNKPPLEVVFGVEVGANTRVKQRLSPLMVRGKKAPNQLAALPHGRKQGNPPTYAGPRSNHKQRLGAGSKPPAGNGSIRNSSSPESSPASAGGEPCLSSPVRFAVALPARWLCRRGIAGGGCWVRGGKELLLEARDSGVALLQLLQALLALEQPFLAFERSDPQALGFLLDVVDGSPIQRRQQAPPGRQGGDPC